VNIVRERIQSKVSGVSNPPYDVEKDPYPLMAQWRQSERGHMIEAIREMIDEARRMTKSKRAPSSERIRWTRLAGQLIGYKDSILRSMSLQSMERELVVLKQEVLTKHEEEKPPPGYMFPTVANPSKRSEI
jgi:hypothetical protein